MGAEALSDRAILGMYYQRLEIGDPAFVNKLAMRIPSSQDSETHKWLGAVPGFREWVGGRHAQTLRDFGITIVNKDFESTINYHERELTEDKTGQLQIRINEHADQANYHDAELLIDLIKSADSTVCYDGQYFFDTDHAEGDSGSQSNDIQVDISELPAAVHGSVTTPSTEEMALSILKGVKQIFSFKNDQGKIINRNAKDFLVVVPTDLWDVALAAVQNKTVESGKVNTLATQNQFSIDIMADPTLGWTDEFAIFRTDASVKPFILQEREDVTVDMVGRGSEQYFNSREISVGLKKAGNVGLGLWQGSCLVTMI